MSGYGRAAVAVVAGLAATSCTTVPRLTETANVHLSDVAKRVKCEMLGAVRRKALEDPKRFGFLSQWSAKVHLTVAVDGSATINPGVTFIEPLAVTGTSRSLGIGVGLSTQAVRTEDIEFFLSFPDVIHEFRTMSRHKRRTVYNDCAFENGLFLESDLDIKSMLDRALAPVGEGVLRTGKNVPLPGGPAPIPAKDRQAIADAVKELRETRITPGAFTDAEIKQLSPDALNALQATPPGRQDLNRSAKIASDALRVERNAQAIVRNIVNPLFEIASTSLAGRDCLKDITQDKYSATTFSAVVSVKKVAVDNAPDISGMEEALREMKKAEKDLVEAAQQMVDAIQACSEEKPPPVKEAAYDPIDLISETVNFYVTYSGSVTPAWKLVRVTAPLAPTFLSGSRKDTNTLIMVMGRPAAEGKGGASAAMNQQVLSSILREAITTRGQ
jgi:hypothetical protein